MTGTSVDLDAIRLGWLQPCGACDAGLSTSCTCPRYDPRPVIAALVAETEHLRATLGVAEKLAALSQLIDDSYPAGIDSELALRRRTGKVGVELHEMDEAIEGYTGENFRKGVYATIDDVRKELLDVAVAALGAYEHVTGNRGQAWGAVANHIDRVCRRAGLPAGDVPSTEVQR